MLLVADSVTIWSPSYNQLADAGSNYGLGYTPEEMLELIRLGIIQVGTREDWLSGTTHRESLAARGFRFTEWNESFDAEIKKLEGGTVTILDKPDVASWVREQFEQETSSFQEAVRLYQADAYDKGWLNVVRIKNGNVDESTVVWQALDTARHHYLAMKDLELNVGVEPWSAPSFFDLVGRHKSEPLVGATPFVAPTGFSFENLLFEMNKTRYSRGERRDFNRHVDSLLAFKENNFHKLLQSGTDHLPSESRLVRDLKRKINVAIARHCREPSWDRYSKQINPILVSGLTTLGAAAAAYESSKEFTRRGLLDQFVKGIVGIAMVTTAVDQADKTVSSAYDANAGLSPSIKLNDYQQALYLMVNGEHRTRLQTDLAEIFLAEIKNAATLLRAQ
ncbi:hypothetical protein B5M44_17995 [Shinella sumterensis]|nr:hypothetical protein B5M44_17995 [Shinella sumterensis]